ncbi:smc3 [Symbiodinium sp. CCMP2592]|nr:smc3 [Symbiodinium sp. CCMP2592]
MRASGEKQRYAAEHEEAERRRARHLDDLSRARLDLDDEEKRARDAAKSRKDLDAEAKRIHKECKEITDTLSNKKPALEQESERRAGFLQKKQVCEAQRGQLFAKQGRGAQYSSVTQRNKALRDEIASRTTRRNRAVKELDEARNAAYEAQTAIEKSQAEAMTSRGEVIRLEQDLNNKIAQELRQVSDRADGWAEKRRALIQERDKRTKEKEEGERQVTQLTGKIENTMPRPQRSALSEVRNWVMKHGLEGDVYGTLLENINVPPDYCIAAESTAGSALFNLLVKDDNIAGQIVSLVRKGSLGSIVCTPLNQLEVKSRTYPKLKGAKPLVDVIQCAERMYPAVQQVFGRTMVCSTLELCDEVSTKYGLDAITMDGDKVSSRGTLTGGYQDPSRFIRLSLNQKMIQAKGKVDAIRPRLVGLEQEVQAANNQIEEIQGRKRDLLQQRSVKRAALATAAESVDEAEGRISRQEDALRQNQERCADLQSYIAQYEAAIEAMEMEMQSKTLGGLTKEEEAQLQQLGEELQDAEKSLQESDEKCHQIDREIKGKELHLKDFLRKRLVEVEGELRRDVPADHEERLVERRKVVDRLERVQKESENVLKASSEFILLAIHGIRWRDSIATFPATIQKIRFTAQQVDCKMQGLEVSGYLSWSVNRDGEGPWNAYKYMAMRDLDGDGTVDSDAGSLHIAEMAKAVVRSQVANSSLQEVLTQRETFRSQVKSKVMEQVQGWGVWVEAIEIADVRICSGKLFEDLQAAHRHEVRLKAEEARLDTDRLLQERRLQDEVKLSKARAEAEAEQRLAAARQRLKAEQEEAQLFAVQAEAAKARLRMEEEIELARLEKESRVEKQRAANKAEVARLQKEAEMDRLRMQYDAERQMPESSLRCHSLQKAVEMCEKLPLRDVRLNMFGDGDGKNMMSKILPAACFGCNAALPTPQCTTHADAIRSPAWHRRLRKVRSRARARVRLHRASGLQPRLSDLLRLSLHHSQPRYRELSTLRMGGKKQWTQEEWQAWQRRQSAGAWQDPRQRQKPKRHSEPAPRSTFPAFDSMEVAETEGDENRAQPGPSSVPNGATDLVKFVQRQANMIRKSEAKLRKAANDKKEMAAKWERYKQELQSTFAKERAKFQDGMEKLEEEKNEWMLTKDKAVAELYETLLHPEAMITNAAAKDAPKNEMTNAAQKEWEALTKEPEDEDMGLAGLLGSIVGQEGLKQNARQQMLEALQKHVAHTPVRPTTGGLHSPTVAVERPPANSGPQVGPLPSVTESPDVMLRTRDPYMTSPAFPGAMPSPPSSRTVTRQRRAGRLRTPIKLASKKPLPTPLGGTPLARKLESVRARKMDQIEEIPDGNETDSEDQSIAEIGAQLAAASGTHPG